MSRIPSLKVPSGRKLKAELDVQLKKSITRISERYLTGKQSFSLSLDIATTRGMKNSYLGLVVTFFDDADRLQRFALDLRKLTGKHDATSIINETEKALQNWNLSFDNVIITVTDGAANMKAAFR